MTAKRYLEQVRRIRQEITHLNEQIETIRTDMSSYHPIQLDDSGASHLNYRTDRMPDKIAKVMELERDLEERKAVLILREAEIRRMVSLIEDPREKEVLTLRYLTIHPRRPLNPIGWEQIGFRMGYSAEGVRHVHDRALRSFEGILKKTES